MASAEPISISSLTIEPSTLGPGQSEIRVSATVNYTGPGNITQFTVSFYRPDRTMYDDIRMSRINDSDRWEGTYTFPADLPDIVLTNFNVASLWFANSYIGIRNAPLVNVTLQRGISVQSANQGGTSVQSANQGGTSVQECNITLTFTGPVTTECVTSSQSQECQTRITISGPVTINCARGNTPSPAQ